MVGMNVRDHDRVDRGGIDAGGGEALRQVAGPRGPKPFEVPVSTSTSLSPVLISHALNG